MVFSSRANGPGLRAVVWVQGCSLGCAGCFNPHTHSFRAGRVIQVPDLIDRLRDLPVQGLTLSGGEPLQQPRGVLALIAGLKAVTDFSMLLFTGFEWGEIQASPARRAVVEMCDLVVAGRFEAGQHQGRNLLGSSNQTVHFVTPRYRPSHLEQVPPAEVLIGPNGDIVLTGVNPPL
ncbi:MAG: 4Fe-4S single cluster domain-containing protein [Vulcanimicrobiota bacterium]